MKKGGSLTTDGTAIYALRGDGKKDFWRYSITDNVWSEIPDAPGGIDNGGSLASDGVNIYALRGDGKKDFWDY